MTAEPTPEGERLRPPPSERFAGSHHRFSLPQVLAELRKESHPARNGHRQIALFHRGGVTQIAFSFDPDGYLAEHSAPGLVTIHTLEGHLVVNAEGKAHDMKPGDILVLDPDVPHDVLALEASAMLLTVRLGR